MSTIKEDDLFQSSHLTLLVSYTIFAAILVVESFLMGWELWALLLVAGGRVVGGVALREQVGAEAAHGLVVVRRGVGRKMFRARHDPFLRERRAIFSARASAFASFSASAAFSCVGRSLRPSLSATSSNVGIWSL